MAINIFKTDRFQLFAISYGKFLQLDQWLALVEGAGTAMEGTDVTGAGKEEVIDSFEYKGLYLISIG